MLDEFIRMANSHIAFYEARAKVTAPGQPGFDNTTHQSCLRWLEVFRKLLEYFREQQRIAAPVPKALGDLTDLPEELLRELSVKRMDDLEEQILTVMRACPDNEANLDQVLVGLFRKFKTVQTRRFIQNKLYRMSQKELIFSVPGQRAVYSLTPRAIEADGDADVEFGDPDEELPF